MKRQFLRLSAYSCDKCAGPVVTGSAALRENEISKEINIGKWGRFACRAAIRQSKATEPGLTHDFPPRHGSQSKRSARVLVA
jgi:hypothetical protein